MKAPTLSSALVPLAAAILAAFVSPALRAQTIDHVIPEVASPGDTVILKGQNLGVATMVHFGSHTSAGVFTIVSTGDVLASPTDVQTRMQEFENFAGPGVPGSSPFGSVRVNGSAWKPIFYTQATNGQVTTIGTPTTQSNGEPSFASFDLAGGPPRSGNAAFVAKLVNAIPGSVAFLGAAAPAAPPFSAIGDGTLVLNAASAYALMGPFVVGADGAVSVSLPIPAVTGLVVNLQWMEIDPALPGLLAVSKALQFSL